VNVGCGVLFLYFVITFYFSFFLSISKWLEKIICCHTKYWTLPYLSCVFFVFFFCFSIRVFFVYFFSKNSFFLLLFFSKSCFLFYKFKTILLVFSHTLFFFQIIFQEICLLLFCFSSKHCSKKQKKHFSSPKLEKIFFK